LHLTIAIQTRYAYIGNSFERVSRDTRSIEDQDEWRRAAMSTCGAWSWPRETRSRFAILIAFICRARRTRNRLRIEWRRKW